MNAALDFLSKNRAVDFISRWCRFGLINMINIELADVFQMKQCTKNRANGFRHCEDVDSLFGATLYMATPLSDAVC